MTDPTIASQYQVAKAFIYHDDRLLLQLRDDKPTIYHPNHWGLFGGSLDPGETPQQAIVRELTEELCWTPPDPRFLFTWEEEMKPWVTYVFATPLTVAVEHLCLTEGQALGMFTLNELTHLQLVPKIQQMLPRVISLLNQPALTAAYQAITG